MSRALDRRQDKAGGEWSCREPMFQGPHKSQDSFRITEYLAWMDLGQMERPWIRTHLSLRHFKAQRSKAGETRLPCMQEKVGMVSSLTGRIPIPGFPCRQTDSKVR